MSAIDAEFVSYKHIPTRKAFQITLEVAEERTREVFDKLGFPNSSVSIRVGIARLQEPTHDEPNAEG